MAVASGLYYVTFAGMLSNSLALNLNVNTHYIGLVNDTHTPDFDTDNDWADIDNEVYDSTNWPTGGVVLYTAQTPDLSVSSGTLLWDAENVSVASTTLSNAEAAVIYAAGLANELICMVDFGSPYSTTNGTFAITWSTSPDAVFSIDLTP